MDTKSHRINLTQKRKARNGQWQFYPVHWDGNKPDPRLIIIDGEPASWKGGGAYFLDWREGGSENASRLARHRVRRWMRGEKPQGWRMVRFQMKRMRLRMV